MTKIRALVFDFDGLILDTESSLIEAYADIHARYGMAFDRPRFLEGVGHADYAFDPWHAFEKRADRVVLETERRQRQQEFDVHLPILPGVEAMMAAAEAAGLKLGIASNSSHRHVEGHLGRLGLLPRFGFLACRDDVASPKPEPDLYRLVVNRFGLSGSEAISFEDSQTGVTAARRAGLWSVAVPGASSAQHDFAQAHLRLKSLADRTLPQLLDQFL